jgi:nuclear protein localization protein 4 homolog
VATEHGIADGMELSDSPGWRTLLAILEESGERPPKRSWPFGEDDGSYPNPGTPSEQLAKRLRGASLKS